ncbi:aminoglycoside phosphotransferase family protein [Millisia brevis]|uniref:aminoglycoside phosphotransferase family protein n=1 Tax=Millisia brevis TaxID=264148 RepID=UPI00083324EC|nr:aminoglycoside phosphotransferase family protein [Millisia brevis]
MDDPLLGRGLAAVHSALETLGRGRPSLDVRSARGSLWVAVPALGIAARVSTHTGLQRRHPERWLARELLVAGRAAELGLPVMLPADTLDPGPHHADGLHLTFWRDVAPDGGEASPNQVADLLVRLHRELTPDGLGLPTIPALGDGVREGLRGLSAAGVDAAVVDAIDDLHRAALQRVAPVLARGPAVVLHGDAHPGNAVHAPFRGWIFIDLEETGLGPAEADLAVLLGDGSGRPAVDRYCAAMGRPPVTDDDLVPWQTLRSVSASVWLIGCAMTYPARYTEAAIQVTIETLDLLPRPQRPGRARIAAAITAIRGARAAGESVAPVGDRPGAPDSK